MRNALIFDCDGVLGDTEQYAHLPAFNRMWQEMGVPWRWSVEEYGRKLKIAGGKERMRSLFREAAFLEAWPACPQSDAARDETIAAWHRRKSAIYREIVLSGSIPPRPGVRRLSEEALAHGWALAVASTSAPESVSAMLHHAVGDATAERFSALLAGDVVKAKKPAPDIYRLAAERLGVPSARCVVIEDSNNGVEAAASAGMRCVVTVSSYTKHEDFSNASIVVTSLGDPDTEPCVVLENRSAARPGICFDLAALRAVLEGPYLELR